jgi:hypothetical protein
MTEFYTADEYGNVRHRTLRQTSMLACPFVIMVAEHYNADESCKCSERTEQDRMIREWDYTAQQFIDRGLREGAS